MLAGHRLGPPTLWVVLLSAVWAMPVHGGDLEDAQAAIEAGDFEAAVALLTPLAASDNTEALYLLGQLYEQGKGVEQDQEIAFDLYGVAALYGHAAAELRMEEFRIGPTSVLAGGSIAESEIKAEGATEKVNSFFFG